MDSYKKIENYRHSLCGMIYTLVTWRVVIQIIADVLPVRSTTHKHIGYYNAILL